MLKPPYIRARQRFLRRYLGPLLASLIVSAGAIYFFAPRPSAAETRS